MKVFMGVRLHDGPKVLVWDTEEPARPVELDPALELWNHSPSGVEWGYNGSGPAQLALAMLYEITEDADFAVSMHQCMKRVMVADLPKNVWARTEIDVLEAAWRTARTYEARTLAWKYLEAAKARCSKKGGAANG